MRRYQPVGDKLAPAIRAVVLLAVCFMTKWETRLYPGTGLDILLVLGCLYVLISSVPRFWATPTFRKASLALTALDILFISLLTGFTGGVRSELYPLFYLPVLDAALRLSLRDAYGAVMLSAVSYVFIGVTGEQTGSFETTGLLRVVTFCVSAGVTATIFAVLGRRIREQREEQKRIRETLERTSAIYSIARILHASLDLSHLLPELAKTIVEHLDAGAARVWVLSEEGGELIPWAMAGAHQMLEASDRQGTDKLVADVIAKEQAVLVPQPGAKRPAGLPSSVKSWMAAPIVAAGQPLGALEVAAGSQREPFQTADLDLLAAAVAQAGVAILNARRHERAQELASADRLTGLWNHGEFHQRLSEETARSRRHNLNFSVLILDVDNFKAVNDYYGHRGGDDLLRQLAHRIQENMRSSDLAARYGGDEFAIVFTETGLQGAQIAAEHLRQEVEGRPFHIRNQDVPITISAGVAGFPDDATDMEQLVETADRRLSYAKKSGKNRVHTGPVNQGE
jgi:diguanylate cyclase (GGDEF)-like protein